MMVRFLPSFLAPLFLAVATYAFAPEYVGRIPASTIFSSSASANSADLISKIRDGIQEAGLGEEWDESISLLVEQVGVDSAEAALALSKALEWRAWAMSPSPTMRKYIKTKDPDPTSLKDNIRWLTDGPLNLSKETLSEAVVNHPATYLLDPAGMFQKVLDCAPSDYSTAEQLSTLVGTDASVLTNTYNCATAEEGCAGNCGRCWVTYSKK